MNVVIVKRWLIDQPHQVDDLQQILAERLEFDNAVKATRTEEAAQFTQDGLHARLKPTLASALPVPVLTWW